MKPTDYNFRMKDSILGLQFLFVAFGALVLVPILTGLDPNVALFTAGIGTLLFQFVNRKCVPPIFLASSFAFIAPISYGVATWGIPATMSGLVAAGFLYVVLSFLIRLKGDNFLHKLLPSVVVGPVIMSIGLILSPVAVNMAMGKSGDGSIVIVPFEQAIVISMIALLITIFVSLLGKGMFKLVPILLGIIGGYLVSLYFGIVDFSNIAKASWFAMPNFTAPEFNWQAIIFILPIAIAPAIEHIGDMLAISNVTKQDYLKNPERKFVAQTTPEGREIVAGVPMSYAEYLQKTKQQLDSFDKTKNKTSINYYDYEGGTSAPTFDSWLKSDGIHKPIEFLGLHPIHTTSQSFLTAHSRFFWHMHHQDVLVLKDLALHQ